MVAALSQGPAYITKSRFQPWALRFSGPAAPELEEAFAQRCKEELICNLPCLLKVTSVITTALIIYWTFTGEYFTPDFPRDLGTAPLPRLVSMAAPFTGLFLMFPALCFIKLPPVKRWPVWAWEYIMLTVALIAACCLLFADPRYSSRACGWVEDDAWPTKLKSCNLQLSLLTTCAAVAIFFPLRPSLVGFLVVFVVLGFMLLLFSVRGEDAARVRSEALFLLSVGVIIVVGRLRTERRERNLVLKEWEASQARAAFRAERDAFMSLLDAACDAHVWLRADGDVVIEDGDVAGTVGPARIREMVQISTGTLHFSDLLASESEVARFREALEAASPKSDGNAASLVQLVTVTLKQGSRLEESDSECVDADLFVLRQPQEHHFIKNDGRAFLVGIRLRGSWEPEANVRRQTWRIFDEVRDRPPPPSFGRGTLNATAQDDVTDQGSTVAVEVCADDDVGVGDVNDAASRTVASVVSTTRTGRVFQAVTAEGHRNGLIPLSAIQVMGEREQWMIAHKDLHVRRNSPLGHGGYGEVFAAQLHGTPVAVKLPRGWAAAPQVLTMTQTVNELRVLRHVRHPNVVLFYGAWMDPLTGGMGVVLEHVEGVSLGQFIQGVRGPNSPVLQPSDHEVKATMGGIARALRYLHERRPAIAHGDLKPDNIMVEGVQGPNPRPKLLDFGLSRVLTRNARPMGGTRLWIAPEVMDKPAPSVHADVFSFGLIIYTSLTGNNPPREARPDRTRPLAWDQNRYLKLNAQDLVSMMTTAEPSQRPPMRKVLRHIEEWLLSSVDMQTEAPVLLWHFEDERLEVAKAQHRDMLAYKADELWKIEDKQPVDVKAERAVGVDETTGAMELLVSGAAETPVATVWLHIVELIMRCNWPRTPGSCCKFHCAMRGLTRACQLLAADKCRLDFAALEDAQCQLCFTLEVDLSTSECVVCGGPLTALRTEGRMRST